MTRYKPAANESCCTLIGITRSWNTRQTSGTRDHLARLAGYTHPEDRDGPIFAQFSNTISWMSDECYRCFAWSYGKDMYTGENAGFYERNRRIFCLLKSILSHVNKLSS